MEKVTFCINTANNEKSYIELLLQSLINGIDINLHDILIFVDSDNQGVTEMLVAQHDIFPNLTIIKPEKNIGYQRNINFMFEYAKTDIVSYLQSDMVVGLDYDKALLPHLKEKMILCSTRVEPPLHSQIDTPITYVKDFGFTPDRFNYNDFIVFSNRIKNSNKLINYYFAPFTLYKKTWNDIGGHDCQFQKSREDSDIAIRFCLNGDSLVQCFDALVYHFTCTSSRGIEWWKQENIDKDVVRRNNDALELEKFVKKWGRFAHPSSINDIKDLVDKSDKIICKNDFPPFNYEVL